MGDEISSTFIVSDDVYTMVKDAALKFFGIQRSGNSESWFHGASHTMDGSGTVVAGEKATAVEGISLKAGDLQGGWYDCGDHLKESQTQAFAFMALAVSAATNPTKDVDHYAYNQGNFVNTDKIPDVLREAKHGADFFLRSYNAAEGVVDNMAVSVGNFGSDHGFWGRPELQDKAATKNRGGAAERDVRLGELGSNISGEIVAGLALVGKLYAKYDADFSDSCLTVAEKMYDFAKSLAQGKSTYDGDKKFVYNKEAAGWSTLTYAGNNEYFDDMALASVALLYATGKETYLKDALFNKELSTTVEQTFREGAGAFEGGWFVNGADYFTKGIKTTSWANSYTYALYALYKLILSDSKTAQSYGLTEEQRLSAIEDCVANMVANLSDVSGTGSSSITLPKGIAIKGNTVSFDPTWYSMMTETSWFYSHRQIGNTFDVLAYADMAADIEKQDLKLPNISTSSMNSSEMLQLGINQLNYILGVNPWDISFIYGVGDKNDNHPSHRAANPEGRNTPVFSYKYVRPVGGLYSGINPKESTSINSDKPSWEDYTKSEPTLDASALLLSALTIASNGGNDYYEMKCDNCSDAEPVPYLGDSVFATAYAYPFNDLEMFSLYIYNSTMNKKDSAVAYIYLDATEKEVEECKVVFSLDICETIDQGGFHHPCPNNRQLIEEARTLPQKVEDSYNEETGTYTWVKAISLDTVDFGNIVRMDISLSSGIKGNDGCEILLTPSTVKLSDSWSFGSHKAEKNAPAYAGAPDWDKDQGELQQAPKAPYVVIRNKGELLWGYGPAKETDDRVGIRNVVAGTTAKPQMQIQGRSLMVQAPQQGVKTLKVFDVLGNQLMAQSFEGTSAQVSLAKLPHRGAMIARLEVDNRVVASKAFRLK